MGDGKNIRIRLIKHGITQREVASRLGLNKSTISNHLSREQIRPDMLKRYEATINEIIAERKR